MDYIHYIKTPPTAGSFVMTQVDTDIDIEFQSLGIDRSQFLSVKYASVTSTL